MGFAIACLFSTPTVRVEAQQLPAVPRCATPPIQYPIGAETPGPDGKINVTYQFTNARGANSTPSSSVRTAFEAGVAQWNAFSATTGVVFEPAQPPMRGDIQVVYTTANPRTTDCGLYDREDNRIYYGSGFLNRAQSNPAGAVTTMAHELGHSLGLGDAGAFQPTIMNNPDNEGASCADAHVITPNVTANDAIKAGAAGGCIQQAREARANITRPEDVPLGSSMPPSPSCYARYQVTSYYTCAPGRSCVLTRVDRVFIGTYCY